MRKLTVLTVVTAAFSAVIFTAQNYAQTKKPTMPKAEVKFVDTPMWYVHYNILIVGSGGKAFSDGGGSQSVTWTIKRKYSGDFKVELERQRLSATETAKAMKNFKLPPGVTMPPEAKQIMDRLANQVDGILWIDPLTAPPLAAYAEINDERTSVFVDRGGEAGVGKCRESKTETWTFGGQVKRAGSYSSFNAKPNEDSARIVFGFAPSESVGNVPVQFIARVEGDCSQDANETNTTITGIKISDIDVPQVENLFVGQGIDFDFPKGTVKYTGDGWQFTSEPMPVSAEIGGFPESKGEVAATLYVKFSKTAPPPAK